MLGPHCNDLSRPAAIMKRRCIAISGALASAILTSDAGAQAAPCKLTPIGEATVSAVRGGGTLALSDGRELKLAGVDLTKAGEATLQSLVIGQPIQLERPGPEQDRYGRVVAYAFPVESRQSLQDALLAQGHARVSTRIGGKGCAEALLATERLARAERRGLWADPNFAPIRAEDLGRLQVERGHFALVEGKVLSVRESGATIYVNFGRRWTTDFTVIILKRQQRTFTDAGIEPKKLEGRRIRVRGWIEQRSGLVVMAEAPEQIELID